MYFELFFLQDNIFLNCLQLSFVINSFAAYSLKNIKIGL